MDNKDGIRLCIIQKWPDFNGFGFNLHAEKAKAGQYIGKVDHDSPAAISGLREGDRIIEVDGVNISNENHQQVVARIKAGGSRACLLVVDKETDQLYKEEKKVITSNLPNVVRVEGPATRPAQAISANGDSKEPTEIKPAEVKSSETAESATTDSQQVPVPAPFFTSPAISQDEEANFEDSAVAAVVAAVADHDSDDETKKADPGADNDPTKGLTAKQLREQLKNRKQDVRSKNVPLNQKYALLEKL